MSTNDLKSNRRVFLQQTAVAGLALPTVGSVLAGCASNKAAPAAKAASAPAAAAAAAPVKAAVTGGTPAGVPITRPSDWEVVAFNSARGAAGAIPAGYMDKIKAADGLPKHLGKHLPYLPSNVPADRVPANYLSIMWGDPKLGYTMHPNAPKSEANPEGHWYNWIRVAIEGNEGSQIETKFDDWPKCSDAVKGHIVGLEDADATVNGGKNSVYLAQLPEGAKSGDTLRVWAHCLTHGEYLDFVTLA